MNINVKSKSIIPYLRYNLIFLLVLKKEGILNAPIIIKGYIKWGISTNDLGILPDLKPIRMSPCNIKYKAMAQLRLRKKT